MVTRGAGTKKTWASQHEAGGGGEGNYSTGEPHMSILDGWTYLGWTYLRLIYVLRSDYCHDNPGN